MSRIVLHISRHKEIEESVMIIVAPGRSGGPSAKGYACLLCDVRKRAVVIVVVEAILTVVRHVNVGPAVVVVVAYCNAKSPPFVCDAGLVRDIGKCAVVIVVEKHGAR